MTKRKADSQATALPANSGKKFKGESEKKPIAQKQSLLLDSDASDNEVESQQGGALLEESAFKINAEYAKRFEHNKKREELQRCK